MKKHSLAFVVLTIAFVQAQAHASECINLNGTYLASSGSIKTKVEINKMHGTPLKYQIKTTRSTYHNYNPDHVIASTRDEFATDSYDLYELLNFERRSSYTRVTINECSSSKLRRKEEVHTKMGKAVRYKSTDYSLDSDKNLIIEESEICVPASECAKSKESKTFSRQN